ncbi:hypothetical protein PAL_GLEAN10006932 [Pteropus alecto]|uniref:Uncharacterized protein n=1 Tax=Pteropus alecto TaxID=9402 RepID=L5JVF8_PTEAL|nr:hypothetical protein PAL_GLEAN10006932 [Pteropus alecto]
MKEIEVKRGASSLGSCVCQLLLNTCEKLCLQLKGTTCPENFSTWDRNPLSGSLVKMNWTNCMFQDSRASDAFLYNSTPLFCSENITTPNPETTPEERSSLGTAATAISGSIGVVALILLLVGLLSMTLKKWRHERSPVAGLSLEALVPGHLTLTVVLSLKQLSCRADAVYSNVINLATWKEDDFAVYANVPPFDRPRRTSPDQVEYASIVFH